MRDTTDFHSDPIPNKTKGKIAYTDTFTYKAFMC